MRLLATFSFLFSIINYSNSYHVVDKSKTWQQAQDYCQATYQTDLATFKNTVEAAELLKERDATTAATSNNGRVWTGLNDLDTDGVWVFKSGYNCGGNCNSLFEWRPNEPNGGTGENCGLIEWGTSTADLGNLINDAGCTNNSPFICDEDEECSWCPNVAPDLAMCGVTDHSEWVLVRAMGPSYASNNAWFDFLNLDNLAGTASATDQIAEQRYNIGFESAVSQFNQFLFTSGDCSRWLIAGKLQVIGEHYDISTPRWVCSSSANSSPYQAKWYNRAIVQGKYNLNDPLISVGDYPNGMIYAEGGGGGEVVTNNGGVYVYVRKGDLDAQGCTTDVNECDPDPCVHGACTDEVNAYSCACQPGWTSTNCDVDIDECVPNQCQNGAQCTTPIINDYSCACLAGWTGKNCDVDIDECAGNPCVHGSCNDFVNSYTCTCDPGYGGENCDADVNECDPDPCVHGTCTDQVNGYTCSCDPGFEGQNCDAASVSFLELKVQCDNWVTSIDYANADGAYQGQPMALDPAGENKCYGKCGGPGWPQVYIAQIPDTACKVKVRCANAPNEANSAFFFASLNDREKYLSTGDNDLWQCVWTTGDNGVCPPGGAYALDAAQWGLQNFHMLNAPYNAVPIWTCGPLASSQCGIGVQTDYELQIPECAQANECDPDPCVHGTCTDEVNGYTCACDQGWEGTDCDVDIDECVKGTHDCTARYAECTNTAGSWSCRCPDGYSGDPKGAASCQRVCTKDDITTFDWDVLTEQGPAAADISQPDITSFTINKNDLSITVVVELQYVGAASADDDDALWGTTYVLDFEDFDAHKDRIDQPGTCQNRQRGSFANKDFVTEYWTCSDKPNEPDGIGTVDTLSYPNPTPRVGSWSVAMKDELNQECETIIYTGTFTWDELRKCKKTVDTIATGDPYTHIDRDDDWLKLTGVFYVNLVSPFWYSQDMGFYRAYQLVSQPFVIQVSRSVYVLGSTGINLMTLSVVAVYKEDQETDFILVLFSETADYLKLTRSNTDTFTFTPDGSNGNKITSDDFNAELTAENVAANECLSNKAFICTQLWQISVKRDERCTTEFGTDFSGNYALTFKPKCRAVDDIGYCDDPVTGWLAKHPDIANVVSLETDLVFKDGICNPLVFDVQFKASMQFYDVADQWITPVATNKLFQKGEDTIYVQVSTTFPSDTLQIFNTKLIKVYLCTFDVGSDKGPGTDPAPEKLGEFGCFSGKRDAEYDDFFYKIYDEDAQVNGNLLTHDFSLITAGAAQSNIIHFSFTVPYEVARDTLWVQAEIEVELIGEGTRRRQRMLLINEPKTSNQIQHFVNEIGINQGPKTPKEPQKPVEEPNPINYNPINNVPVNNNPIWALNLSNPWVIAIGGLLCVILSVNILFMVYLNCCSNAPRASFGKKRKGYSKVNVDSEFDSEAQMIPNQL